MASIYDIAGTLNSFFTIGDNGITILYGNYVPTLDIGKIGDIYVQNNKTEIIKDSEDVIIQENISSFGRIYYKTIVDGKECWEHIKNYSFDEPIISVLETELNSNNYKVSIQKASQPTSEPTSTSENDFEISHNNYGVVRFSTDTEAKSGNRIDTVVSPKQLIDNINDLIAKHNVAKDTHQDIRQAIADEETARTEADNTLQNNINKEEERALAAEKVLQDNIDKEATNRTNADNNLQSQIDAINARKDVIDILGTYEELLTYENEYLSDGDIIKVLSDSQHNDRQSYYKWDKATTSWNYIGSDSASYTIAESDALLQLKADLESPSLTGTPTTPTADITSNNKTIANTEFTQALVKQYDDTNVHLTGDETIDGIKTFNDTIISTKNGSIIDVQSNGVSVSNLTSTTSTDTNGVSLLIANDSGEEVGAIDLVYNKTSQKSYVTIPEGESTDSTTSLTAATEGWANDPTKSLNIVHKTGDELIDGNKSFVNIPTSPTATKGDSSTNVATTEFVQAGLDDKQDTIVINSTDNGKFLSNNGTSLNWSEIADITELKGLYDVNIENPEDGQVLVYNADKKKWVNGLQTTATIKYW